MNEHLDHLAERVAGAPDFLASALAEYARSERLTDAALAAQLGCTTETWTSLRLCRMPRPEAPMFWEDVERIGTRFGIRPDELASIVRQGQALLQLRGTPLAENKTPGTLLAARDRPCEPLEDGGPT